MRQAKCTLDTDVRKNRMSYFHNILGHRQKNVRSNAKNVSIKLVK